MMTTIRAYQSEEFGRLCQIHDPARRRELALAGLSEAFLPLKVAAGREGLFEYQLYVAEYDGVAAGFVAFTEEELAWLYVDVQFTRRGIGRALVAYALAHMNPEAVIEVLAGNEPALALYRSFGFEITKTVTGVMPGNERFGVTCHVMQRQYGHSGAGCP